MSTPSRSSPWAKQLSEDECKLGRALAGGHKQSIAKAVMGHQELRKAVTLLLLDQIDDECSKLCQRSSDPPSLFRKVPVTEMTDFQWDHFLDELRSKAPTLLQVLSTITSRNDHRNEHKCGRAHNPGICMAAAIVLKERNREMCGVQSIISLLMFSSHVEKQVGANANGANNYGSRKKNNSNCYIILLFRK